MLTAVVPLKPTELAKGRLSGVLDPARRGALARQMADHVLQTLREAGISPVRVANGDHDLNADVAAAARLAETDGATDLLLVMADLPYLTPADIGAMIDAGRRPATQKVVVIAEAKDGGTNALLLRPPTALEFAFSREVPSSVTHAELARRAGIEPVIVRRPGLAQDIDTPADLAALAGDHPAYQVFRHVA
jgi:2-phospho-L-lactate guanylyltransferase (CobY/MobA/RfbA family)